MSDSTTPSNDTVGHPCWEVVSLLPTQGNWSESDYLSLSTNRLVELSNGYLEVPDMPTWLHQWIVKHLCNCLDAYLHASKSRGVVLMAPLPVRLFPGTIREPDLLYVKDESALRVGDPYLNHADLVIEIVSEDSSSRTRDYTTKRKEYALAGIDEYWIVDPFDKKILVLSLNENQYVEVCSASLGKMATSRMLKGFTVAVDDVFQKLL